jgi:hypothetical protein
MKMASQNVCFKCFKDKSTIKMFSAENNMDPVITSRILVEQQLICRISPAINIHMLRHGGIAANGHCVTFPQEINEPAKILPKLPSEVNILKVKRKGKDDNHKEYRVRRYTIQNALIWLKNNNPAYSDITFSSDRLNQLPLDNSLNLQSLEVDSFQNSEGDQGPAPQQVDTGLTDGFSESGVLIPEPSIDINGH